MRQKAFEFVESLRKRGSLPSIVDGNKKYSYWEFSDFINRTYDSIRDINEGDVVLLWADYSFESLASLMALYLKGCIIAPVTMTSDSEINEKISTIRPNFIISFDGTKRIVNRGPGGLQHTLLDKLRHLGHAGLILSSSGSTGKPKIMLHDLDRLVDSYPLKETSTWTFILILLFDHIGGLNTVFTCLSKGHCMVIPRSRNVGYLCALVSSEKVNVLPASPTFLNLFLIEAASSQYDFSDLRLITYGTEPMPDALLIRAKKFFPKVRFHQTFGTSETGIVSTLGKASNSNYFKINDSNTEYKIVDNELWLRSKTQIDGYLNYDTSSFTEDGWFKTGDMVDVIDQGYFRIIGRFTEVINVGGLKVLPSEVESIVMGIDGVLDCLVYALPNAIMGNSVACDLFIAEGVDPSQIKRSVIRRCKENLEAYKVPVRINFVEKFSITDRLKKRRLRD